MLFVNGLVSFRVYWNLLAGGGGGSGTAAHSLNQGLENRTLVGVHLLFIDFRKNGLHVLECHFGLSELPLQLPDLNIIII